MFERISWTSELQDNFYIKSTEFAKSISVTQHIIFKRKH